MGEKIIIDPVTRIEGHLKVEVEVENGVVKDAWVAGTMFRGWEVLLQGRDPRDASYVTERVCGVCAGSHGWASAMALDEAFGVELPSAARILRNLMLGAMWLHDHPLHFYHLSALDYLDVMAVAQYNGNDKGFQEAKARIMKLVQMKDTAPLTPRYEPDEFSVKDPELVTLAVSHYLKALEMQAKAKKMSAIFSGKQPHQSSIVAGGVTCYPTLEQLAAYKSLLMEQIKFVEEVYVPDVLAFGTGPLLPLAQSNVGVGYGHFMAYGSFPQADGKWTFNPGLILNGDLKNIIEPDQGKIVEEAKYSYYKYNDGLNPYEGNTEHDRDKNGAYSWVKSPRYDGMPIEVGPLARMLVHQPKELMDIVTKYNIKPGAVARHAARAIETKLLAHEILKWVDELGELIGKGDIKIHDTAHWNPPAQGKGAGIIEAPRGALGHYVVVEDQKIANYQMVVPSTWNFSPRDIKGQRGPVEQSLIGTPVPDPKNPTNVVRIIRSYDPCLACAIHVIEPENNKIHEFRIG